MKEICVITGASRGLGKEIAKEMLLKGNDVCLIARNGKELESTKTELSKITKQMVLTFAGDVSDEKFVKMIFSELKENYRINYLINNAGVGRFCKLEENTREIIDEVLSASLIGTILVTSNAMPLMKEDGTIANIMSTAAIRGIANETAYCAAKWGARGFTEALKTEFAKSRLKIVSIFPGGIDTPFWNENRHYVSNQTSDTFMNPAELGKTIVESLTGKTSLCVKELVIERLK